MLSCDGKTAECYRPLCIFTARPPRITCVLGAANHTVRAARHEGLNCAAEAEVTQLQQQRLLVCWLMQQCIIQLDIPVHQQSCSDILARVLAVLTGAGGRPVRQCTI